MDQQGQRTAKEEAQLELGHMDLVLTKDVHVYWPVSPQSEYRMESCPNHWQ